MRVKASGTVIATPSAMDKSDAMQGLAGYVVGWSSTVST